MPPKNAQDAAAKKADAAKRAKKLEDATFGLKNKKGAKAQQFVETLKKTVEANTTAKQQRLALADPNSKEARAKRKAEEEARNRELNEIFVATIKQPKVPAGVDPKSVVCEFFRKGACAKGFKCKFSHDLAVERKAEKIDIFSDRRGAEGGETMEDWDQEKLEATIAAQQGKHNLNRPTDIICKHFLEAIEKKQYGWFWTCPAGGDECKYRHALPPGYVLKSQIKALAAEAAAGKKTLEEEIEEQRASIAASTPVTEAVFQAWKKRKLAAKAAGAEAELRERERSGRLSGRELTSLSGFTFEDDEEAGDGSAYAREDDEEAVFAAAVAAAAAAQRAAQAARGQEAAAPEALSESLAAALEGLGEEEDEEELQALAEALQEAQLAEAEEAEAEEAEEAEE